MVSRESSHPRIRKDNDPAVLEHRNRAFCLRRLGTSKQCAGCARREMPPHRRLNCTAAQRYNDAARTAVCCRESCDRTRSELLVLHKHSTFDLDSAEVALRIRSGSARAKKRSIPMKSARPGFRQYRRTDPTYCCPLRWVWKAGGCRRALSFLPIALAQATVLKITGVASANTSKRYFRSRLAHRYICGRRF